MGGPYIFSGGPRKWFFGLSLDDPVSDLWASCGCHDGNNSKILVPSCVINIFKMQGVREGIILSNIQLLGVSDLGYQFKVFVKDLARFGGL